MLAAPPGSLSGALVADAYIEHWFELVPMQRGPYFAAARDELHYAAHRSIWHPGFPRSAGWVHAASTFAMAFSLSGDEQAAASTFSLLGNLASDRPWDYLGQDVAAVVRARRLRAFGGGTR